MKIELIMQNAKCTDVWFDQGRMYWIEGKQQTLGPDLYKHLRQALRPFTKPITKDDIDLKLTELWKRFGPCIHGIEEDGVHRVWLSNIVPVITRYAWIMRLPQDIYQSKPQLYGIEKDLIEMLKPIEGLLCAISARRKTDVSIPAFAFEHSNSGIVFYDRTDDKDTIDRKLTYRISEGNGLLLVDSHEAARSLVLDIWGMEQQSRQDSYLGDDNEDDGEGDEERPQDNSCSWVSSNPPPTPLISNLFLPMSIEPSAMESSTVQIPLAFETDNGVERRNLDIFLKGQDDDNGDPFGPEMEQELQAVPTGFRVNTSFPTKEHGIAWVNELILLNARSFLNELDDFSLRLDGTGNFSVEATFKSPLSLALMQQCYNLQPPDESEKICLCGCGGKVLGRREYSTEACRQRTKNNKANKRVKAFIRGRMYNGKMSEVDCKNICETIDNLYNKERVTDEATLRKEAKELILGLTSSQGDVVKQDLRHQRRQSLDVRKNDKRKRSFFQ